MILVHLIELTTLKLNIQVKHLLQPELRQLMEGTHKSEEPVSKFILKDFGGVPILYCLIRKI